MAIDNINGQFDSSKLFKTGSIAGIISLIILIISGLLLVIPNLTQNDRKNTMINATEDIIRALNIPDKLLYESKIIIHAMTYYFNKNRIYDLYNTLNVIKKGFIDAVEILSENNKLSKVYLKSYMLDLNSKYYEHITSFTIKYITLLSPPLSTVLIDEDSCFFELLIRGHAISKFTNEDCDALPLHRRIYFSFVEIIQVLTDGYAAMAATQRLKHDEFLAATNTSEHAEAEANFIKQTFERYLREYNKQIDIVAKKAKWALDNSDREQRNCGSFKFSQGETFDYVFLEGIAISTQHVTAQQGNVITGIRWRVERNVIYLDIQQGKFINKPSLDSSTVFWTKTPANDTQVFFLNANQTKIDLADSILSSSNHYVTGVQLYVNKLNGLIGLSVSGVENPDDVNLNPAPTPIPDRDPSKMRELSLEKADDPMNYVQAYSSSEKSGSGVVNRQPNYYVKFQHTASVLKRAIPYLDVREITTNPPTPLSGIGIYHQAHPGYGGLLGLRIFSSSLIDFVEFQHYENITKIVQESFNNITFFTEYGSRKIKEKA